MCEVHHFLVFRFCTNLENQVILDVIQVMPNKKKNSFFACSTDKIIHIKLTKTEKLLTYQTFNNYPASCTTQLCIHFGVRTVLIVYSLSLIYFKLNTCNIKFSNSNVFAEKI